MTLFSKEKIRWIFRRHPLLYYTRYLLLSRNLKGGDPDEVGCYSDTNKISDIPRSFTDVNQRIAVNPLDDPFDKALTIAAYLRKNIKGGRGLGYSSDKALALMLSGDGGVCSDFSQIFNNFCLINDIRVKEWGCLERFFNARFAHTFNEIYSPKYGKWIAIDVHQAFYFTDDNQIPLSGVEIFQRAREGKQNHIVFFTDYQPPSIDRLRKIYGAEAIPFLIVNYRNREIDRYYNKFRDVFPVFVLSAVLILLRKNFHFLFVLDDYKAKMLPRYFQKSEA